MGRTVDAAHRAAPAMRILVSNDDGYFSPGIALLAEALRALGEVTVVAPERDRSRRLQLADARPAAVGAPRAQRLLLRSTARPPTACTSRSPGCSISRPTWWSRASTSAPTWATTRSTPAPWPRRPRATCSASRRSRCRSPASEASTSRPPSASRSQLVERFGARALRPAGAAQRQRARRAAASARRGMRGDAPGAGATRPSRW